MQPTNLPPKIIPYFTLAGALPRDNHRHPDSILCPVLPISYEADHSYSLLFYFRQD